MVHINRMLIYSSVEGCAFSSKLYAAASSPKIGILGGKKTQVTSGWFTLFQVVCVVHNFKGSQMLSEDPQQEDMMGSPRVESPLEKYIASQVQHSCIYPH